MNMFRASQPIGGPSNTKMNPGIKQCNPPIKLHLDVHPPILDITPTQHTPPKSHPNQQKSQRRPGGVFWKQLSTVYHTVHKMCSASTPVSWVNPEIPVHTDPHLLPYHHYHQYPPPPITAVNPNPPYLVDPNPFLWYPAQPGDQQHLMDSTMDALGIWPCKAPHQVPPYTYRTPPDKFPTSKINKPLNPEAEEWVPNNYYTSPQSSCVYFPTSQMDVINEKSSVDSGDHIPIISNSFTEPAIPGVLQDFCEITENEVEAVRKKVCLSPDVQKDEETPVLNKYKVKENEKLESPTPKVNISSDCPPEIIMCKVEKEIIDDITMSDSVKDDLEDDARSLDISASNCDNSVSDSSSISYASVVGRTPPSPPPSPENMKSSEISSTKFGNVVQPLPKIFVKDKTYPKEKAVPSVENKCKNPELFKALSKSQKASSKNFLKELKSSPIKCQTAVKGNIKFSLELSFNSEMPLSPPLSSSPKDDNPLLPGSPTSTSQKSQQSVSESSSTSSRVHSISESSVTSLESLDIEFGCDELETKASPPPPPATTLKEKKPTPITSPKYSILACILGQDDSDSEDDEDEEEDSDDDWDRVCVENGPIDDTWETFGFGLIIDTKILPCPQPASAQSSDKYACDSVSDEDILPEVCLGEINRKWEEEVEKDVLGNSGRRVNFGGMSTHPMVTWTYAYRAARRGPWEQYARDRARFSQRIASLEPVLSQVLKPEHRDRMYQKLQDKSCPS